MNTLAQRTPPPAPAPAPTARLLAVRKAGAAFDGPFSLRSPRYERLLEERARLRLELEEVRRALLDTLHRAVPGAADRAGRRLLLDLKRDVFNARAPSRPPAGVAPEIAAALSAYRALLDAEDSLFAGARGEVVAEQRAAVAALLADGRFRAACRYSSADLWEAVEHAEPAPADDFSSLERGLYAYACKYFSKCNPLHLFAEVLFPPGGGIQADGDHEVVLDASLILELERDALERVRDPRHVWLALRPFLLQGGKYRFWAPQERGFRVLTLPAGGALDAVAAFFAQRQRETGRPAGTRAECVDYMEATMGPAGRAHGPAFLDALVRGGIAAPYLVTELGRFGAELAAADPAPDARVAPLSRIHLARMDTAALAEAEAVLARELGAERRAHYVNSYARLGTELHEVAAQALGGDLRDLKPFFSGVDNFTANSAVAEAYLREQLAGGGTLPVLELLGGFASGLQGWIQRFHPDAARAPEERARAAAWTAALAAEAGHLDRRRLGELLPAPPPPERALCFNGPFDYARGIFYLSNVWAGDARYVSRYLLHRGVDGMARPACGAGCIDVELAVPPRSNLDYVVRSFATGCGFDSRYAHRYERWIDPAEIRVEIDGGRVAYRHGPSGARLRIHYRGFMLARFLPAEYQLLLVGHADTPRDPFAGADEVRGGELRHVPSLHYGAVCLRRERWVAAAGILAEPLGSPDPLRRAAALRDWVHERLAPATELWYYRTSGSGVNGHKPQLLDLRNPLGVTAFRRAVAALGEGGAVSFSPMLPVPEHLHSYHGARYVTELMVEL